MKQWDSKEEYTKEVEMIWSYFKIIYMISCKIERQKKIHIYYSQNIRKLKWSGKEEMEK